MNEDGLVDIVYSDGQDYISVRFNRTALINMLDTSIMPKGGRIALNYDRKHKLLPKQTDHRLFFHASCFFSFKEPLGYRKNAVGLTTDRLTIILNCSRKLISP